MASTHIDNDSFCLDTFTFDIDRHGKNLIHIVHIPEEGIWSVPNALWICDLRSAQYIPFIIEGIPVRIEI